MNQSPCFCLYSSFGGCLSFSPAIQGEHVCRREYRAPAKRERSRAVVRAVDKRASLDPDDLPEPTGGGEVPTQLTLAQELLMKSYAEQIERMGKEEANELACEVLRQSMVKNNLLSAMGLTGMPDEWKDPPDPASVQGTGGNAGGKGGAGGSGGGEPKAGGEGDGGGAGGTGTMSR